MRRAFIGGTLIDGTGRDPVEDAVVLVDGDRVAEDPGSTASEVEAFDLTGLTVLPGLIDLHTHLGVIDVEGQANLPVAIAAARIFDNLDRCLASGHTTAREVAGLDGGAKQAVDLGLVTGPRLYPSGPLICQTGGHGDLWFPWLDHHHARWDGVPGLAQLSEVADGPEQVRVAVRRAFQRGATQIKVCVSGGVVSLTDDPQDAQYSVGELRAAVEEAEARSSYVTAHAHNVRGIASGLEAGVECFEHGTWLDEVTVERMAAAGAALVPTFAVTALALEHGEEWGIPREMLPRFQGVAEAMQASLKLAFDAGVTIGSGTDILGPQQEQRGLEIGLKAEIIGSMEAIVSATRTNAQILRAPDLGTLEAGKIADLIAVDFDPLAEPDLFANPDRVKVVVKGGDVVKDLR